MRVARRWEMRSEVSVAARWAVVSRASREAAVSVALRRDSWTLEGGMPFMGVAEGEARAASSSAWVCQSLVLGRGARGREDGGTEGGE